MEIIWTQKALSSIEEVSDYISLKFSEKEVENFIVSTLKTIETISNFPKSFPASGIKKLKSSRKAVIHPHSTLIYQNKNTIILLLFWDNRKDPSTIKYQRLK